MYPNLLKATKRILLLPLLGYYSKKKKKKNTDASLTAQSESRGSINDIVMRMVFSSPIPADKIFHTNNELDAPRETPTAESVKKTSVDYTRPWHDMQFM